MALSEHPHALTPAYWSDELHEPIVLYQGLIRVTRPERSPVEAQGKVTFAWLPSPAIKYRVWRDEAGIPESLDPLVPGEPAVELVDIAHALPKDGPPGPLPEPEHPTVSGGGTLPEQELGDEHDLKAIVFNVINFTDLVGSSVIQRGQGWARARITLHAGGWAVTLDARSNLRETIEDLRQTGGFAFTHVGRLEREDGSTFFANDTRPVFDALFHFLSFVRGALVGVALPVGLDEVGRARWAHWRVSLADAWRFPLTWSDKVHPEAPEALFPAVLARWGDPFWSDVLRRAIRYYVDANDPRPVDRAVIMSQAALELLSWTVVVEDQQILLERKARNASAADRIRHLLRWASIPDTVPAPLKHLAGVSTDGPEALTRVRNRLAHPKREDPAHPTKVLIDAWRLGQWWVELALLRILDYRGVYGSRLSEGGATGQVDPVPWAESA